jgi:hypothetical protein
VFEKIAQNVAQTIFGKLNAQPYPWKKISPKMCASLVIFKNLSNVNNRPCKNRSNSDDDIDAWQLGTYNLN